MRITVDRAMRRFDPAMFADITSKQVLDGGWDEAGTFTVQFAVNLTTAEADAVQRRLLTATTVEETLHERAWAAMDGLRTITGSTGTLTATQASNAIRLLARCVLALIRLQLRRLDTADDTTPPATPTTPQTVQGVGKR